MRAWIVVAVLVAGCAGGPTEPDEPEAFKDLEASSADKGIIRGVVVDQSITPVEGATVVARPGGLEATTDVEGAFGFTDLEPGVYFLTAKAPYHTEVQTSVDVEAGVKRPPVVRIALEALPKPVPAVQEIMTNFFMDGSVIVLGTGFVAGGFLGEGTFSATHDIATNASWVQSELVWEAAQPFASDMRIEAALRNSDDDNLERGVVTGTSPLLQVFDDETVPPETQRIWYRLFVWDGTYPAGATIAQDLQMFTHVFQHFTPNDGWRFSSDGAHPVPPPP